MRSYFSSSFYADSLSAAQEEAWKAPFDIAQVRAMTTQSLALRVLSRSLKEEFSRAFPDSSRVGVYAILEDSEPYAGAIEALLASGGMDSFDFLRQLPPKHSIAAVASISASQMAIELKACGPLHCIWPSARAAESLLEQIELDFQDGNIDGCVVGMSTPFGKYFDKKDVFSSQGAFVGVMKEFSARGALFEEMMRFCKHTGAKLGQ